MEQMNLFTVNDWKVVVNSVLEELIESEGLPKNSIGLYENYSRDRSKVTSYSVFVTKPDYPKGVNVYGNARISLLNIQIKHDKNTGNTKLYYCVPDNMVTLIAKREFEVEFSKRKSDVYTRVMVDVNNSCLRPLSVFVIQTLLNDYFVSGGGHRFGCCCLYLECSDARKCLHENKLYARGCAYFHNLSAGKIFYGKNRNID